MLLLTTIMANIIEPFLRARHHNFYIYFFIQSILRGLNCDTVSIVQMKKLRLRHGAGRQAQQQRGWQQEITGQITREGPTGSQATQDAEDKLELLRQRA